MSRASFCNDVTSCLSVRSHGDVALALKRGSRHKDNGSLLLPHGRFSCVVVGPSAKERRRRMRRTDEVFPYVCGVSFRVSFL